MIHIVGERGSGKTKKLLQTAIENDGIFVTSSVKYTRELAKSIGIDADKLRIMSYSQFLAKEAGTRDKYYIDEIDSFLLMIANNEIAGISINMEANDIVCLPE